MTNPVDSTVQANPAGGVNTPSADAVRGALREVIDPEVGLNIVDMGLVYRVEVTAAALEVEMTMTSPSCPMGDLIMDDATEVLQKLLPPGLRLDLRLVWLPLWEPSMMSPRAKKHFDWQ